MPRATNGTTSTAWRHPMRFPAQPCHESSATGRVQAVVFTAQCQGVCEQGEEVEEPRAGGFPAHPCGPCHEGEEEEKAHLDVLEFGDPCDGFHLDGMGGRRSRRRATRPGISRRSSKRQRSRALTAWRRDVDPWYPAGSRPQRACPARKVGVNEREVLRGRSKEKPECARGRPGR